MQKGTMLYLSILAFILLPFGLTAQTPTSDTTFVKKAITAVYKSYREATGLQAHLYTGPEYYVTVKSYVVGHQFFGEKTFQKGNVMYDGSWYTEVPMLYEVVQDEVVIMHQGTGYSQMLVKAKVDTFQLSNHTFIHLREDSLTGTTMKAGYYDLRHSDNIQMLVKRAKSLQERATNAGMEGEFDVVDDYFIWKEGGYYPVKSKGSVLKVLRDEKKQLSKFIREEKIKFRKNRENAILLVARHYDSLKK